MPRTLDRKELLRLARLGAEARLEELERERTTILRNFPGIQTATRSRGAANGEAGRRRGGMSAAARKAVSIRMRKYWAERRKTRTNR